MAPSTALHQFNEVERSPRMSTFEFGWYWTPRSDCRQGTEMEEADPSRGIMLNSRGEWRTKTQVGTGESDRLRAPNKRKLAGLVPIHFPHYMNSPELSVALGESWLRRSSPLIFNSLHNNIWFDTLLFYMRDF